MKKTPTIFERDWNGDRSRVVDQPNPDAAWVFAGEGVATRKLDGTCCMIRGGKLYKRREIKKGQTPPPEFELVAAAIREISRRGETVSLPVVAGGVTTGPATVSLALEEFANLTAELPAFVWAVKKHIDETGGAGGYLFARLSDVERALEAMNIEIREPKD